MAFPLPNSASGDAVIKSCGEMKYPIYCISTLHKNELFEQSHQFVAFALAMAALTIPAIYAFYRITRTRWKKVRRRRTEVKEAKERNAEVSDEMKWNSEALASICADLGDHEMRSMQALLPGNARKESRRKPVLGNLKVWKSNKSSASNSSRSSFDALSGMKRSDSPSNYRSSIRSFVLAQDDEVAIEGSSQQNFDLRIVHLLSESSGNVFLADSRSSSPAPAAGRSRTASPRRSSPAHSRRSSPAHTREASPTPSISNKNGSSKHTMGLVDVGRLYLSGTDEELEDMVESLNFMRIHRDCHGLVLRITDQCKHLEVTRLLRVLRMQDINSFIMANADSKVLKLVEFMLLDGVILQNATILPNGQRRAFFQAKNVRDIMAKSLEQRKTEPGFFLGFVDLWDTAPGAAVARRAFKLAEYYGATVYHGPKENPGLGRASAYSMSLSAFDYLKRDECVRTQKGWMKTEKRIDITNDVPSEMVSRLPLEELGTVIPDIDQLLWPCELPKDLLELQMQDQQTGYVPSSFHLIPQRTDFWTTSGDSDELSYFGAFPLSVTVTPKQYHSLTLVQKHLKSINMLEELLAADHKLMASQLNAFLPQSRFPSVLQDLVHRLMTGEIQIYRGLVSGFKCPESEAVLYGLSTGDVEDKADFCVYLSRDCPSDAGTLLHIWYACFSISRMDRYEEELRFTRSLPSTDGDNTDLPTSISTEISQATTAELLYLIHQTTISQPPHPLFYHIQQQCSRMLTERKTQEAWIEKHSKGYLDGSTPLETLLWARLEYFVANGASRLPSMNGLLYLARMVEHIVSSSLLMSDRVTLDVLFNSISSVYVPSNPGKPTEAVDINTDLFALIFFCSLRRAAFEDVYIETTDRCPFLLTQPDQAAVFSELWVLGSQCEIYFGVLPRTIGEIIYDRYRKFLQLDPPDPKAWDGKNVLTAYSYGTLEDDEQTTKPKDASKTWKNKLEDFGALSIFCVPALIDILLLTTIGRGLFLTAFMHPVDRQVATHGVLGALLLSSGITGWTASVGGYHLYHKAFHNMNYFLIQRLSAGLALTFLVAILGFLAQAFQKSPSEAGIFVAYLFMIATYLILLGILATMHDGRAPMTSGRTVLWRTMPILLLSPVLSIFIKDHDLAIYLSVLYTFVLLLMIQYRNLSREWTEWLPLIPSIKEKDINQWYQHRLTSNTNDDEDVDTLNGDAEAFSALAALAFRTEVEAASHRKLPSKAADALVAKAVVGFPYADWLVGQTTESESWTSTWLVEVDLAVQAQQQLLRGLKEHSIFILWRYGQYDMAANICLFLVALMDQWVGLVMSARTPTTHLLPSARARFSTGLALVFFLLSAIALDYTLQEYWSESFKSSEEKLIDAAHAKQVAHEWVKKKYGLWFEALLKVARIMLAIFGLTTLLMWLLVQDWSETIMYYAYIVGFAPVLLMQFNRAFTTSVKHHVASGLTGAAVGFIVGCTLRAIPYTADFTFTPALALISASWTAAILTTIWVWIDPLEKTTKPTKRKFRSSFIGSDSSKWYFQTRIGVDTSQDCPLDTIIPIDVRNEILDEQATISSSDRTPLSQLIRANILQARATPNAYARAAPWSAHVIETACSMWINGKVGIVQAKPEVFTQNGEVSIWSFSRHADDELQIATAFPFVKVNKDSGSKRLAAILTEIIFHHVARAFHGFSVIEAVYAEHLLSNNLEVGARIQDQLAVENATSLQRMVRTTGQRTLKHLCLSIEPEIEWDSLSHDVRTFLIARVAGKSATVNKFVNDWLISHSKDQNLEDFAIFLCLEISKIAKENLKTLDNRSPQCLPALMPATELVIKRNTMVQKRSILTVIWQSLINSIYAVAKWLSILSGGATEVERELVYSLRKVYGYPMIVVVILTFWNVCRIFRNQLTAFFLVHRRPDLAHFTKLASKGLTRTLFESRIKAELISGDVTGFASQSPSDKVTLSIFQGILDVQPSKDKCLATATYDGDRILCKEDVKQKLLTTFHYNSLSDTEHNRYPFSKRVEGPNLSLRSKYDDHGRVISGHMRLGTNDYKFTFSYTDNALHNQDILAAEYRREGEDEATLTVCWGIFNAKDPLIPQVPVPGDKVTRVIRESKDGKYITYYEYQHKQHPVLTTFLSRGGRMLAVPFAPPVVPNEAELLEKPKNLLFHEEDLLIKHSSAQVKNMKRWISKSQTEQKANVLAKIPLVGVLVRGVPKVQYTKVPTWKIRAELWKQWLKTKSLDAATACWLDEYILRREPLLKRYWRLRGFGLMIKASNTLDEELDHVVAAIELPTEVSQTCLLPIKPSDLFEMGLGQDANQITNRPKDCYNDTFERISVVSSDMGCYPTAPGGVSNCRRDLVNGHSTISNHILAESANEYGISRFQVERNINSMRILPLWGLDHRTAFHGIIDNLKQSEVDEKIDRTDVDYAITQVFIPILQRFIKGARTKLPTRKDLLECSNALLNMFAYFENYDYNATWHSKAVETAWIQAWLEQHPGCVNPSEFFEIERPSISDMKEAMNLYIASFFIYSVKVPDDCPRVFQSTHHGISSLLGMFMKHKKNTTYGLWDHAILWRETVLNISMAKCLLPPAVQAMYLAGIGLAARLAYLHADTVAPCTSVFNPDWEIEVGTDQGRLESKTSFARKIDPIVNGIGDMSVFKPVESTSSKLPTVVMLSNIQFIKDIRTAVLAADVIVNEYGFTDYRLRIYGAQDREPEYMLAVCQLIQERNLSTNVVLAGFGKPTEVLKEAWAFMNSSLSEGLPLAIAEAALSGVPIVATEVGGTALVLTDATDKVTRYGAVVPPNDPTSLARAQLELLAMMGPWRDYTYDEMEVTDLPRVFNPRMISEVMQRMYDKADDRRKLGMLTREVVLKNFHGARYLREHEQLYHIGWHISRMREDKELMAIAESTHRYGRRPALKCSDETLMEIKDEPKRIETV